MTLNPVKSRILAARRRVSLAQPISEKPKTNHTSVSPNYCTSNIWVMLLETSSKEIPRQEQSQQYSIPW
jgi:hypothetical protein